MGIDERIFEVIDVKLGRKKIYEVLERSSGISRASWKNAAYKKQRATSEMIEFVCKQWPEYCYWIGTGAKPYQDIEHTTAQEERFKRYSFHDVIRKEPLEWTSDEEEFMQACLKKEVDYATNPQKKNAIDICFGARMYSERLSLSEYIEEELSRARNYAKQSSDAVDHDYVSEFEHGIEYLQMMNIIDKNKKY